MTLLDFFEVDLIGYSETELPEEERAHPGIRIPPVLALTLLSLSFINRNIHGL
jgi:hypothetical protein